MRRTIGGLIAGALWRWWRWRECVADDAARRWNARGKACTAHMRIAKDRQAAARSHKIVWKGRADAAKRGDCP